MAGTIRLWLVLGRVSNLPTVWSNCLAGWLLAGGGPLASLAILFAAASLLYIGGMYLNDACDAPFDREFRIERPIPAGAVSAALVFAVGTALLVSGAATLTILGARTFALGTVLGVVIILYDVTHGRITFAPVLMAACRFLLYLTAASAAANGLTWKIILLAFGLAGYIGAISLLARTESRRAGSDARWLAFAAIPIVIANAIHLSWLTLGFSIPVLACILIAKQHAPRSIGQAVTLLLAAIVLVDLVALSPHEPRIVATFAALFFVTMIFQRYIPAN